MVTAGASEGEGGDWFSDTVEFWKALDVWNVPIEEDDAPEAVALKEQNEKIEQMQKEQDEIVAKKSYMRGKSDEALGSELNKMPILVYEYYKMKAGRVLSNDRVKAGLVSFLTYANVIFIGVVLRSLLPRLITVTSFDDLLELAGEIGIPSKSNMISGLNYLQEYEFVPKFLVFTLCFIFEKLTLISEVLPIQVGLKTISPILFGGLVPGALISATCETIGATVNFLIGRQFITNGLQEFEIFGDKKLKKNAWFNRLEAAAEKDSFKLVLLLRLARIVPLPFDFQWYILGALPVRLPEFVVAHWLGCLKTAFLDASIGLVLLTTAGVELAQGGASQNVIYAESAGFTVVAILVQTFATGLVKDILGLDDKKGGDPPGSGGEAARAEDEEAVRTAAAAAEAAAGEARKQKAKERIPLRPQQAGSSGGETSEAEGEGAARTAAAAAEAAAGEARKQKAKERIPLRTGEAPAGDTASPMS
ncbi:unnamed protein product [Prorocentrum cordatum]|uniref:VTT domain-containing protein n=1 Tax=Prorocentrum cordatum TaxID=2364126 RepID=A0ABN9XPA2_9DINO|nr:unnamed protein product [Polarella glacialis]